jgi:hypothetical protein
MPTGGYRSERTAEGCSEQERLRSREAADSLAGRPSGYLPPSDQQCGIADMQKWLDLCA